MKMTDTRHIILVNEDDCGYGYTVSQDTDSMIYAMFWAKETETKLMSYLNLEILYEKSLVYVQSDLRNLSALHEAKYRMCIAFIDYCRDKNTVSP